MYIDDVVFQCPLDLATRLLPCICAVMPDFPMILYLAKLLFHIPALRPDLWAPETRPLSVLTTPNLSGIKILDTDTAGRFACSINNDP